MTELGKFLTNTTDPYSLEGRVDFIYSSHCGDVSESEADRRWDRWLNYIKENIIGPPKATRKYTAEQLEKWGKVGIYAHPIKPDRIKIINITLNLY